MNSQVVHQAHRPFVAASTPRRHVCVCRSHQHGILSVLCREQAGIGRLGEFRQQLAVATANAVLAGSLLLGSPQTAVAGEVNLAADPVYGKRLLKTQVLHTCTGTLTSLLAADGATILKQDARDSLSQSLRDLDRCALHRYGNQPQAGVDYHLAYDSKPGALAAALTRQCKVETMQHLVI